MEEYHALLNQVMHEKIKRHAQLVALHNNRALEAQQQFVFAERALNAHYNKLIGIIIQKFGPCENGSNNSHRNGTNEDDTISIDCTIETSNGKNDNNNDNSSNNNNNNSNNCGDNNINQLETENIENIENIGTIENIENNEINLLLPNRINKEFNEMKCNNEENNENSNDNSDSDIDGTKIMKKYGEHGNSNNQVSNNNSNNKNKSSNNSSNDNNSNDNGNDDAAIGDSESGNNNNRSKNNNNNNNSTNNNRHMCDFENGELLYKCEYCDQMFDFESALDEHTRKHSLVERLYYCNKCHKRYRTKKRVKIHISICQKNQTK